MGEPNIKVVIGDLTKLDVEAIVYAGNSGRYGGGVSGKIARAAGPAFDEAWELGPVVSGYDLPARRVVKVYFDEITGLDTGWSPLKQLYQTAFDFASEAEIRQIAFPAIGTGYHKLRLSDSARIGVETAKRNLKLNDALEEVQFCCIDDHTANVFRREI